MRPLLRLAVAAAILVSTWFAILTIAEHKVDALAGGGSFRLDRQPREETSSFASLLSRLASWDEPELAAALDRLRESGDLWVAPQLAGERSAIYVNALGLVSRIYVRREELLVSRSLPFPGLEIPAAAQRLFATIRLAGTLFHELQHYQGLEDEAATYDRELEWYAGLREKVLGGLEGNERVWSEWALDSAHQSALAARDKARGLSVVGLTASSPGE